MTEIKMVDLFGQYNNHKKEFDLSIQEVINSSAFINGPSVTKFQSALSSYLNINHVITCANGTDALQIALMSLELEKDAEIIVPSFSFIAPAEVVSLLGFKPVFAEVDAQSFNICPKSIEKLITKKTKAIIVVHLFGQGAEMDKINSIAKGYNLFLIEDNAQSIGARFTLPGQNSIPFGTIGDFGTTSFFPSKNLGCMGDGGAIFTNNHELAAKASKIGNHGQSVKYNHDLIGINSRLDSLQAAILNVKLKYLDQYIIQRQKTATIYHSILDAHSLIRTPSISSFSTHVYNQFTIQVPPELRLKISEGLKKKNIPTMVYYPKPLHLQNAFFNLGTKNDLKKTEQLSECVISLPMHTEISEEQAIYIAESLIEIL